MNRKNKILIYFSIFILISLTGCKGKSDKKDIIKKKDIAPKSLKEINMEISSIMDYIGDIEKINLGIDLDNKEKQKEKGNISTQNPEDPNKGNKEAKSEPEPKKPEPTEEKIKNKEIESSWKSIDKSLEKIYTSWNEYGVEAIKKGATSESIDEVENSLSKLTKGVEDKDILTIYNHGSRSLKALNPLYGLYKDEIGGEVSVLKYMVYQYYVNGIKGSTNTSLLFTSGSEDEINKIRLKLEDKKDKGEKIDKVSFGFKNLSNTLDKNSKRLLMLKKDALIKDINSLEN